jgi:hypothetical protein
MVHTEVAQRNFDQMRQVSSASRLASWPVSGWIVEAGAGQNGAVQPGAGECF